MKNGSFPSRIGWILFQNKFGICQPRIPMELFFGIYTEETLERYGDYINLYKNKNWVRAEK